MPNILVVEDSRTQAEALRLALETGGFVAEVVSSGEAALARLAESAFDLVLCDILLPGLSGYDVCRRIKAEPRTQDVPVLLLTVLTDPLDVLQGLECGADNFLTKPCDPDFLLPRVHAVLNGGRDPAAGVGLAFRGRGVTITRDKEQILDLLLSTLEEFVRSRQREHEERVAREALERSEGFVRAALDALPMCVAILDGAGAVLAVNGTWQRGVRQPPVSGKLSCGGRLPEPVRVHRRRGRWLRTGRRDPRGRRRAARGLRRRVHLDRPRRPPLVRRACEPLRRRQRHPPGGGPRGRDQPPATGGVAAAAPRNWPRPTAARPSSSLCWPTNCAIRWHLCRTL